ncbi:MAG: heat-inducible transcription repressor HrcA [Clostridia bacterium]|nr:heat-inducible transcription repressor HrcA [Clostridia bacterium]
MTELMGRDEELLLSDRKKKILKAIIDAHIAYGEPVGSKYLAQDAGLNCSSATIRNEMAELEAMGLLEQPHTSAGRVPSELGYRYYVNALLRHYRMTTDEIEQINRTLRQKVSEMDGILAEASRLASRITNYTGFSVKPRAVGRRVEKFEGVFRDPRNFVLVMLLDDGSVKTRNIRLSFSFGEEDTERLIAALNEQIAGASVEEISLPRIRELERRMGSVSAVVHPIVSAIYDTLTEDVGGDLQVEGVNRLLQYPEYSDVGELRSMMDLLETKEPLLDVISTGRDSRDVNVYIGSENNVKVMSNSTLVFKTVRRDGRVVGAIGIIGPRRMDYAKVISTIDELAAGIDHLLKDDEAPENGG